MKTSTDSRRWVMLAAVLVGTFTGAINGSVANVAVLDVMQDFDLDVSTGAWFVLGYPVAFVVLMPVVGRLAGRVGLRRVYLTGMGLFATASVVAAVGAGYSLVVTARVLQGVGGASILPVVMLLVSREFPHGVRGRALGIWASVNGAALALGPVVGGLVVDAAGWRMIFWLDVPLCLAALVLANAVLPGDRAFAGRRVDLVGIALLCGGLGATTLAVSTPPTWGIAGILQLLTAAIGGVLLVAFWHRSHHVTSHVESLVGVEVLRNRAYVALSAMAGLQMMLLAIVLFATPLMLSTVFSRAMTVIGLVTSMLPVSMIVFSPLSGYVADRIGSARLATVGGLLLVGSTATLASGVGVRSMTIVIAGLVVAGIGVAAIQAPVSVSVVAQVAEPGRGAAMGLFHSARFSGAVVGITMSAAVLEWLVSGDLDGVATGDLQRAFVSTFVLAALIALLLVVITSRFYPGRPSPRLLRRASERSSSIVV